MSNRISQALRMAGQKVRDFDDKYASILADYIGGFSTPNASPQQVVKLGAALSAGAPATRKFVVDEENAVLRELMGYGVPALNAGVRYGVPAALLYGTAQGINGLYDLASDTPVLPT